MNKFFIVSFLVAHLLVFSQKSPVGKIFPACSGETFSGKSVSIPSSTKGKYTILWLAFSRKAEDDMKTWLNPVYNYFILTKNSKDAFSAAANYDINFYFIPLLNRVNQALGDKEKIKNKTDKEFWPYILFFKGEVKQYLDYLSIEEKDTPYFFVLDDEGKIIHQETGKYSEGKLSKIEDFLE